MQIKGSCVCGAVRFEIKGPPSVMGTCHCSRCRKLGTSTIVFVKREQFKLLGGAENIETVAPEAPFTYTRSFCLTCGTSLGEPLSPDASFPINAHCLDDDPGIANSFHEFTQDRPAWAADPAENSSQERTLARCAAFCRLGSLRTFSLRSFPLWNSFL